jgi:Bacterial protein of unknown function (DUF922)
MLLIFAYQSTFSQKKKTKADSICWTEGLKLKWSDFVGKPSGSVTTYGNMKALAFTYTNITATGVIQNDLPEFTIFNKFVKSKSWVADSTMANLLNHERLHFDIAELYARKIRKGLADLVRKKVNDIAKYSTLIDKSLKELEDKNREFDQKTVHGTATPIEKEWEQSIAKELLSLKDYKSTPEMCNRSTK